MRLGVQSGITDLSSLKSTYNRYANGGYKAWKKAISAYKHLDIDNDRTYDYESYFNEDPQRAWDMMNKDSEEHFTDKYKTVYHPTFSNESVYSGRVHSKYNPQGEVGGRWTGNLGETYVPNRNSSMTQDQRIDRMLDEGSYDRPLWRKQHAEYGPILPELEVIGKSGKRFDDGGTITPNRTYQWVPAPEDSNYTDYNTGAQIQPGQNVWANAQGNIVSPNDRWAKEDYATQYGNPQFYPPEGNLPNITIDNLGNREIETDYDRMLAAQTGLSTATYNTLQQYFDDQFSANDDPVKRDIRAAQDIRRNQKFDSDLANFGEWQLKLAVAALAGSYGASALWSGLQTPLGQKIAGDLLAGEIGGRSVDLAASSFGQYENWGDMLNKTLGINRTLADFTNPGYLLSGRSLWAKESSDAATALTDAAMNSIKLEHPHLDAMKANIQDFSRGLGIEPQAVDILGKRYVQYPVAAAYDAAYDAVKTVGDKVRDAGFFLKNIFFPRDFDFQNLQLSEDRQVAEDQLKGLIKSLIRPSKREQTLKDADILLNLRDYVKKEVLIEDEPILTTLSGSPEFNTTRTFKIDYQGPKAVSFKVDDPASINTYLEEEGFPLKVSSGQDISVDGITASSNRLDDLARPLSVTQESKNAIREKINEINTTLEGLGHVTGSAETATYSYATHSPADFDIVTTRDNALKVVNKLDKNSYFDKNNLDKDHFNHAGYDIQIIQPGSKEGTSKGQIAHEIYAKLYPEEYAKMHNIEGPMGDIPMSPEDLLVAHEANVRAFSQIDQMLSGKPKHRARTVDILRSDDSQEITDAYNNMITGYRGALGKEFRTLEEQGINIDYSNVEANRQFLESIGVTSKSVIDRLASSPDKMKFITEEYAYQRSTAVRSIALDELEKRVRKEMGDRPRLATNWLKSQAEAIKRRIQEVIRTNASYSNYGGNWARYRFGGDPYGGYLGSNGRGIVNVTQFPIRHGDTIHSTMDLFMEMGRYSISDWGEKTLEAKAQSKYFTLPENVAKKIQEIYQMPEPPKTLNDVAPFTVRNRNPKIAQIDIDELSKLNQALADVADIDYLYSNQSGFDNAFFGVYRKDIPGQTTVSQLTTPNQYGFELPKLGLTDNIYRHQNIFSHLSPEDPIRFDLYRDIKNRAMAKRAKNIGRKKNVASDLMETRAEEFEKVFQHEQELKDKIHNISIPIGITVAGLNGLYGITNLVEKSGVNGDISNLIEDFDSNIKDAKIEYDLEVVGEQKAYGGPLGNMFKGNGNKSNKLTFKSSPAIRERIANWEGASMYAPAPDTHKVNNSFENEDALFWSAVPDEVKPNLTQDMSDALYSLSYNIGAGNFKNRVSPVLVDLFKGKATVNDVMDSMYGTNDSKYRGLQRRRAWEKDEFKRAFNSNFGLPPYLPKQQETPEINPFLNVPEVTLDDIKPVQYVSDPAKQQELWTPNLEDDYNTTLPSFVLDLFTPSRQKKDTKKTTETPKSKYKGIKFDEGGEFNIDLPGITVYQPIQKEIPDFYKEAVREVGG